MKELATKKLKKEFSEGKYDRYAEVMKQKTCDALIRFCGQNEEFAQAVYQGGSFENCMKKVAEDCGNGISDLDAYRRAVRFYFPGADIKYSMTINLCADVEKSAGASDDGILLDLSDFL